MGNVRETRLIDLWPASAVRKEAAAVADEANEVLRRIGGARSEASFCPAISTEITGDPPRTDEWFDIRAMIARQVRQDLAREQA